LGNTVKGKKEGENRALVMSSKKEGGGGKLCSVNLLLGIRGKEEGGRNDQKGGPKQKRTMLG